jgi:hypothetical protein
MNSPYNGYGYSVQVTIEVQKRKTLLLDYRPVQLKLSCLQKIQNQHHY